MLCNGIQYTSFPNKSRNIWFTKYSKLSVGTLRSASFKPAHVQCVQIQRPTFAERWNSTVVEIWRLVLEARYKNRKNMHFCRMWFMFCVLWDWCGIFGLMDVSCFVCKVHFRLYKNVSESLTKILWHCIKFTMLIHRL